jgi:hypothetical protein
VYVELASLWRTAGLCKSLSGVVSTELMVTVDSIDD